jgi:hypothetical protein
MVKKIHFLDVFKFFIESALELNRNSQSHDSIETPYKTPPSELEMNNRDSHKSADGTQRGSIDYQQSLEIRFSDLK